MDDFSQKLRSILTDPESVRNLSELAEMLKASDEENPDTAEMSSEAPPEPPQIDVAKLLSIGQALTQAEDDKTAALILALRPHLTAERAKRADRAVKLLRLYTAAGILRESGMLQDLI